MSILTASQSLPTPSPALEEPIASRTRSNSNLPPPRYSLLTGALPARAVTDSDALRPPRYSSVFHTQTIEPTPRSRPRRHHNAPVDQTIDSAAGPSSLSPQKYEYNMRTSNKNSWATVVLFCRSGSSSGGRVPTVFEGDSVNGSLQLVFDPPQTVNSISVVMRGRIHNPSSDSGSYTFFEHPVVSWVKSSGDPRCMTPPPPGVAEHISKGKKFDGKLSGDYNWPFSFPFPTQVTLPGSSTPVSTPPTFSNSLKTGVHYELALRISHGMLRTDSKMSVDVVYVPHVAPAPGTLLRQLAFREGHTIPSPDVDPEGWVKAGSVVNQARLPNKIKSEVRYTLRVSDPQSFTRGTFIPVHLTLASNNSQLLSQLALSPANIPVCLVQGQEVDLKAMSLGRSAGVGSNKLSAPSLAHEWSLEDREEITRKAVWASAGTEEDPEAEGTYLLKLMGEIKLDRELSPSSDFPLSKVMYSVNLYAPEHAAFKYSDRSRAMISQPVTIATRYAEGSIPISISSTRH